MGHNKFIKTLTGIFIFIISTYIFLYALELLIPKRYLPQETGIRNLYYPSNYSTLFTNIEYEYELQTNDQGLRYRSIPLEKNDNTPRIFVLGDSFTEGVGVKDDETYSSLLEKEFSYSDDPAVFINGGFRGTSPLHYYLMFKHKGLNYNPDALIIALYANDLGSIPEDRVSLINFKNNSSKFSIKKLFKDFFPRVTSALMQTIKKLKQIGKKDIISSITSEAKNKGVSQQRIDEWRASIPENLALSAKNGEFNGNIFRSGLLYPEFYLDSIDLSSDKAGLKWKNMTTVLSEIIQDAQENGIEVAMIYIPSCFQYDPNCQSQQNPWVFSGTAVRKEWLTEDTEIQQRLSKWSRENHVAFLDLTPTMRNQIKTGSRLNYPLDGHWNARGHKEASKTIEKWLSSQDVFTFIKSGSSDGN